MDSLKTFARRGLIATCAVGVLAAGSIHAATVNPGAPGATSLGRVDVDVTVDSMVWIQRLEAISLTYVPATLTQQNEPFCIWTNQGTGDYDLTITSTSTTFQATGDVSAATVDYTVRVDTGDADASNGTLANEGDTFPGSLGAAGALPAACTVDNAAIFVDFVEAGNMDSAVADTYRDEVQLLIEPR